MADAGKTREQQRANLLRRQRFTDPNGARADGTSLKGGDGLARQPRVDRGAQARGQAIDAVAAFQRAEDDGASRPQALIDRLVFTTGDDVASPPVGSVLGSHERVLQKPFEFTALRELVESIAGPM